MVVAAAGIVGAGWLLVTPPLSILGALGIVVCGIAFSIGATWLMRRSWAKEDQPSTRLRDPQRVLKQQIIIRSVITPLMLAGGAVLLGGGEVMIGVVTLFLGLSSLALLIGYISIRRRALAFDEQTQPADRLPPG
ncbi:hypothetical protein [Glaciibacter flavus]|uniref:hypothetical protein n=1 Tax=Orlajensenia flava TaxID=2565934 RepID=UPI003AFF72AA